ncbi:hypothetical protein [Flavivirga eckloniae]|uniref:Uncharacterized protein n=1 Tax=Flavivirga eckloniae TaxID=1803846 RepID=A0A2K9PVL3_9FLAO|nr:hypothetical protein [Flavivirga eckloniae]AUP80547.1 hypothetical protein C1H87_18240 [Flavivirga eckloniae]
MGQSNNQAVQVETKNKNTYKYYQIEVSTGQGVVGKIMLNGEKIHDFNKEMTQLSRNLELEQLKNGTNKLILSLSKIPINVKKGYFEEALITIVFHAVNEKVFTSKETEFFKILWDPKPEQTEIEIEYLFDLNL